MMTGFTLVKWKKVEGDCCVGFGNGENVGERCVTRDDEGETPSRVGEEFNESMVWNELRWRAEFGRCRWLVQRGGCEACVGCLSGVGLRPLRLRWEGREASGGKIGASGASRTGDT